MGGRDYLRYSLIWDFSFSKTLKSITNFSSLLFLGTDFHQENILVTYKIFNKFKCNFKRAQYLCFKNKCILKVNTSNLGKA